MGNNYRLLEDGKTVVGSLTGGLEFMFDAADFDKVKDKMWYPSKLNGPEGNIYVTDRSSSVTAGGALTVDVNRRTCFYARRINANLFDILSQCSRYRIV